MPVVSPRRPAGVRSTHKRARYLRPAFPARLSPLATKVTVGLYYQPPRSTVTAGYEVLIGDRPRRWTHKAVKDALREVAKGKF